MADKFENPKFTPQVISDINHTFDSQVNQWIATLHDVELTFGISKQRQRQLIATNRVPGVARLNDRNYIYQRDVAFEFYKGYSEFNSVNVATDEETYIDPFNGSLMIIPKNKPRELHFSDLYEEQYRRYVEAFEPSAGDAQMQAAYDQRIFQFQEWATKMQAAILGV